MLQSLPTDMRTVRSDLLACRAAIKDGSRSFYAASLLLPRKVRDPAYALYAFCRFADDAVDLGPAKHNAIKHLSRRLDLVYAGRPFPVAADRALAHTVRRFSIPRDVFDALLEGFAWDAEDRQYETISELRAYAVRVAGTVGSMMAVLLGARDEYQQARACDLGVAMQLTNIARDVGEDARAGRLYLPRAWLREEGIDPDAFLADPQYSDALGRVTARLLAVAKELYERALPGIAGLPLQSRPAIHAARLIYAEIGRNIETHGFDSVSRRAVISRQRKIALLAHAVAKTLTPASRSGEPVLEEARFLVDAVTTAPLMEPLPAGQDVAPRWHYAQRLIRTIELFDRLERMDRADRMDRSAPQHRTRSTDRAVQIG